MDAGDIQPVDPELEMNQPGRTPLEPHGVNGRAQLLGANRDPVKHQRPPEPPSDSPDGHVVAGSSQPEGDEPPSHGFTREPEPHETGAGR